jgi:hypothetical protein
MRIGKIQQVNFLQQNDCAISPRLGPSTCHTGRSDGVMAKRSRLLSSKASPI